MSEGDWAQILPRPGPYLPKVHFSPTPREKWWGTDGYALLNGVSQELCPDIIINISMGLHTRSK